MRLLEPMPLLRLLWLALLRLVRGQPLFPPGPLYEPTPETQSRPTPTRPQTPPDPLNGWRNSADPPDLDEPYRASSPIEANDFDAVLDKPLDGLAAVATHRPVRYSQAALFSPAERSFYGVLTHAAPHYLVLAKVRVSDLIHVAGDPSPRTTAQNRLNAKHVDFVLCTKDGLAAVAAIELDDNSHKRPDRQERDKLLDSVFAAARLPLLRMPCRRTYRADDVRQLLAMAKL